MSNGWLKISILYFINKLYVLEAGFTFTTEQTNVTVNMMFIISTENQY
jgi:hypothetical protein